MFKRTFWFTSLNSCSHSTQRNHQTTFYLPSISLCTGDEKMNSTLLAIVLMELGDWEERDLTNYYNSMWEMSYEKCSKYWSFCLHYNPVS